jgi:hypothetical protein
MEQNYNIKSTLRKLALIGNLPIQFSINDRRTITFRCPTVREVSSELGILKTISLLSLTPETIKKQKIPLNFNLNTKGDILQSLIFMKYEDSILNNYFVRFIENAEIKNDKEIFVQGEKVLSFELQYIADIMLVGLGQKEYEGKDEELEEKKEEEINPAIAKILQAQKESEEKLKKAKQKKSSNNKLTIEEVMLSLVYEFGIPFEKLLDMNYFGVVWCFGYVGKVDAHKMNQMILSSGMSKEKNYSYWLNK